MEPREVEMYVMGLMQSISTNGPLELEAIVVKSFDELHRRKDEVIQFGVSNSSSHRTTVLE